MAAAERPVVVSIVGKKNSGKTTLLVGVAAELRRRGLRVASVKHGHHAFEMDQPGRDSWRHVHEGGVEAVLLLSAGKLALIMSTPGEEPDVREAIERHLGGRAYDAVLVEGYKHGELPKIEIYRREIHDAPVYNRADPVAAARFLAIVSDDPALDAECPVIPLDPGSAHGFHVQSVAELIERRVRQGGADV